MRSINSHQFDSPRENNYFYESFDLVESENRFISRVSNILHREWRIDVQKTKRIPVGEFNIHFFYASAAEVLAQLLNNTETVKELQSIDHDPIRAVNFPSADSLEKLQLNRIGKMGFVEDYVRFVTGQSKEAGCTFDLDYALTICCNAFDTDYYDCVADLTLPNPFVFTHEDWLNAFNS